MNYDEVFDLVKNGDWTITDFAKWLNEYEKQSFSDKYDEGYDDGYAQGIYEGEIE